MSTLPEPWLRGPMPGVHPLVAPLLFSFQQAREDLAKYTEGLTPQQLWATPHDFGSPGFHIRHIAGSTGRLMKYVRGGEITDADLADIEAEKRPGGPPRDELLALLDRAFRDAEATVRALDPAVLPEARAVGRKHLPTTVSGLLTHIAEHTQRHVGQAISAAKWARVL